MAKNVTRKCPACGEIKSFRSDVKTCGCCGTNPRLAATDPEAESAQVIHLRKEVQRLQNQVTSLKDVQGFRQELIASVIQASAALEPLPPIKYDKPSGTLKKSDTSIAAVLKLSDHHIGEQTAAAETEGFGEYNWEIAQARMGYITQKFLRSIQVQRRAFHIPKLYIFGEGDFVSGDIHNELRVTNEFPLPVQAVCAGALLAQTVATLAPHFEEVHFIQVGADNHGRLNPKPQAKQKSSNNMSFVVYSQANALLRSHKNVEPLLAVGMKQLVTVEGINFLVEHGDNIRGQMGIPWYGFERMKGKEAFKRMQAMLEIQRGWRTYQKDIGFDYWSGGHYHVPSIISENILVNGSLSGTSEFDHSQGRYALPSQVSFLVNQNHGIFGWTAWRIRQGQDRRLGTEEETHE